jgi:NADP-dependent 3-hydroxy acid dehydrogenase YdfG
MPASLKDKVILITGASSGFGADAAHLFAREGCVVILAARRLDRLTQLAADICAAGGQAYAVGLDVTEQTQIEEAIQTILDRFGRIDILFNNAGFGRLKWLERLDPVADIDAQLDVNLRGLIQVTRAALPSMLRRGSGHIINNSSVSGLIAAPLYTIYAAAKYGVRGFTDALRREVAPFGVKVSGLYPGPAETEFSLHTGGGSLKSSLKIPKWVSMSSEYVARRAVGLARHPRRSLVIPWWFRIAIGFDTLFPWVVDWIVRIGFVQRNHHPPPA